ncbi:unnamed protein product [Caenorhabditis nigoni]
MKLFLLLILIPFSISFDLENSDRPDTVTHSGGFNSGDSDTTVTPKKPQNDFVETTVTQEEEEDCKKTKKTTVIPKPAAPVNSNHGDSPINFDEEEDGYSTPSLIQKIKEMQEKTRNNIEDARKRIEENKAKLLEKFKNFKN